MVFDQRSYTAGQSAGWLTAALSATADTEHADTHRSSRQPGAGHLHRARRSDLSCRVQQPADGDGHADGRPFVGRRADHRALQHVQNFAAPQGGADPAAQTVDVTNGGDGTLDGLAATLSRIPRVSPPDGWPLL